MKIEEPIQALSPEQLLKRIHTINHFWKSHQSDEGTKDAHGAFFRHIKQTYQLELLRLSFPSVYLEIDAAISTEETYSIRLPNPVAGYTDAAHIPKRFVEEFLTMEELSVLVRNYPNA